MTVRTARPALAALLLAAAGTLTACGPAERDAAGAGTGPYPMTVTNCGAEVTLDKPPERIVMLKSSAVPYLAALGVLDRVVARAGAYPDEYYDQRTRAQLAKIPLLTDRTDSSGHLQISKEAVLAQRPDLVLGEVDTLNRDTLAAADIPLLEEPAMCPEGIDDPGFDDVYSQMRFYGRVFDRDRQGARQAELLRQRTGGIVEKAKGGPARTAAILYPTVGGGTTFAYGSHSMAHPQLEAAGLKNVFGDVKERVFEVAREELIARNPDVLVLLYTDGTPDKVRSAITAMPGANRITAVREQRVLVQLFNFTEPPTPLSVDGLDRIVTRFSP